MIPPSVPLVIYAILTQESIGKLFMAAVVPGIIAMIGYMIVVRIMVTLNPAAGPAGPRDAVAGPHARAAAGVARDWRVRGGDHRHLRWLGQPDRAAAIGAAACGILAIVTGGMRMKGVIDSALGTATATAMIFLVLLGADMLNTALALSQMPVELAAWGERCQFVTDAGDDHDPAHLRAARLRNGLAGDDPAHHPDLLSDCDGVSTSTAWAPPTKRVVWHPGADGGGNRSRPSTGGYERLHHQPPREGRRCRRRSRV